jgi:Phospholipase_D-nuclease N-terminal
MFDHGNSELTPEQSMFTGILGILVLILDIIAIIDILGGRGSAGHKLVWFLVVLFLPVVGMLLYFLIGKNKATDL